MAAQENSTSVKINAAEKGWHNTFGEYFLRYAGIFLALSIVAIGLNYGYTNAKFTPDSGTGHVIKHDKDRAKKTLLFVSLNSNESYNNEANVLKEAIASYHGVKMISLTKNYDAQDLHKENHIVFVLGSQKFDAVASLNNLMKKVAERNIPLFWLGNGFSKVAHIFEIPLSGEDGLSLTPPLSSMTYKGTEIASSGLPFSRTNMTNFAAIGEVIASVKLHDSFNRPALIRHGNIIYSAFNPLSKARDNPSAPFALSVIMDSLSLLVGEHKFDRRVIFRLEDINGGWHNKDDSSFKKTTDYLKGQGIFLHLGIIPTMVDAKGKIAAQIDAALPVLKFVNENPDHVEIIQHGYKHWRKDPRNEGLGSGVGFEFFQNDDQTMGERAASKFAKKVIQNGYEVMHGSGLTPQIFEAPHYEISPSQQQVADKMFSLMQHRPYYKGGFFEFFLPWFTQRNTTVYGPDSPGYVDISNKESVNNILASLEKVARILPDPIVIVFYHPFMSEAEGREDDLKKLVQGIKDLNYRFVNMLDEVEPASGP